MTFGHFGRIRGCILYAILLLSLSACAPMTEKERYAHEDKQNLAREEFEIKKAQCQQVGGTIQMKATSFSRYGRQDYKSARCVM